MRTTFKETSRGYDIFIDDLKLGPCFTLATGRAALERLCATIEPHAERLLKLCKARDLKHDWNIANYPNGRNWPEFRAFEKAFKDLQKEAGIKDT